MYSKTCLRKNASEGLCALATHFIWFHYTKVIRSLTHSFIQTPKIEIHVCYLITKEYGVSNGKL